MKYIAIDFETANSTLSSACSIGLVLVEDNKVKFMKEYLINPEVEFSYFNKLIHNITEEDVINEAKFPFVWEEIKEYFQDSVVVAHNADFDLAVLKAMLEKYDLVIPNIKYACTLKISRIVWKNELLSFKLSQLSQFLEVEHNHHNALSDAYVCCEIINRALKVYKVDDLFELQSALSLRFGLLSNERFYSPLKIAKHYQSSKVITNEKLNNASVYLAGKPSKRTRKQMTEDLLVNGVFLESGVTRVIDYFIVLGNCPKVKLDKAKELVRDGAKIKLLSEDEIYKIIRN